MDVPGVSAGGNDSNNITGNWKIIESNQSRVALEFYTPATGEKLQGVFELGQDRRLYSVSSGKKLLTGTSDSCR